MRTALLIATLLGVVALAHGLRARLDAQEVNMNRMSSRLSRLTDLLTKNTGGAKGSNNAIDALNGKLNAKYGDGCDDNEFQCGGSDPQCIGKLLVCDGDKECTNGADEEVCDNPMPKGSVWKGTMSWDRCTSRKPDHMTLAINSAIDDIRVDMEVSMAIEKETESQSASAFLLAPGYYDFAEKRLVVKPPETDDLGIVCTFDQGSNDKCTGYIVRIKTYTKCAAINFVRVR